jgi:hypothetical protein
MTVTTACTVIGVVTLPARAAAMVVVATGVDASEDASGVLAGCPVASLDASVEGVFPEPESGVSEFDGVLLLHAIASEVDRTASAKI